LPAATSPNFPGAEGVLLQHPTGAEVPVQHDPAGHRFVSDTPGGPAELVYSFFADTVVNIEHTEVPRAARGLGVADALIRAALGWAREQGYSVMATCPFAQRWLAAHPGERPRNSA
jgi:uncharacterized protein